MGSKDMLADYLRLKGRGHELVDAERTLSQGRELILAAMVDEINKLATRIEALESAATHGAADAQPEVANTGSGAAPVDPAVNQASDSATQPPVAAGTTPGQPAPAPQAPAQPQA